MRTAIASAFVIAALGFGVTAPAGATVARSQNVEETYRTTVHYGDLEKCRHDAISGAVKEINNPLVTQAYEQHAAKLPGETATHRPTPNAPHA
jgi:hypothetical protein